jgi:ATP-dependent Zn protease
MLRALLSEIHDAAKIALDLSDADAAGLSDLDLAAIFAAPDIDAAQAELSRLTTPDTPSGQVTLADVHGQPAAKQALEDLCADLAEWRAGRLAWSEVTRSFLLHGPPGNGKTMLSEALAGSAGVPLIATSYADNQRRGHQGDMLKGLTEAVSRACTHAPSIFFLDEIDAFHARGQSHNGYIIGVVTGLLTQLDRLMKTEGVILLAATNHPDTVDPAIRRAGRFDRHIPVTPPDRAGVQAILAGAIPDIPAPDLARLVDRLLGQSGAEITALVRAARTRARRRGAALAPCDLDVAAADLAPAPDPDTLHRVAVHEAGHLLAGHLFGAPAAQRATLQACGGAVERPKHDFLTRARIDALVRTFLGGRAAEALVFEEVSSGAGGGEESDLAMATQLLTDAEMRLGLGEALTWQSPDITTRLLAQQARTRIEDALRTAEAETREALTRHRAALERIAEALLEKRELQDSELAVLLDQVIPDMA